MMRKGWLTKAGAYKVEHITWPYVAGLPDVDVSHPPLGLLHTTQGPTVEGALSVFRERYAPHFTVGVDAKLRPRIIQHVPLGKLAAALQNDPGGVETNREVRVQIEIVGYARKTIWLPAKPTLSRLAALLAELEGAAGIPLTRAIVGRDPARWRTAKGWLGHVDAPENEHWDPGKLNYPRLLQLAGEQLELGHPVNAKPKKAIAAPLDAVDRAVLIRRAKKTPPAPLCGGARVAAV